MGGWRSIYGDMLERVLDEHKESAVGVIGCWAKGINYPICELDLLVISNHQPVFERRIEQQLIIDLVYVDEQQLSRQSRGLLAKTLSECVILQDPKLLLASLTSSAKTCVLNEGKALAASALTNSVGYLGLAKRALKEGCGMSGGFWLLSAGYSLLEVLLWAAGDKPHPSHLLSQLRSYGSSYSETLRSVLGIAEATTTSVKRRLDLLSTVYEAEALGFLDRCELETSLPTLASKKALYLLESNMVVDAYIYLGYLIIEALKRVYRNCVELLPKARLHRFIEDLDDKGALGKGAVRAASFPLLDTTLIQEVEQITFRL
ncbi:MAG: hypothetical protein ACK4TI_05710, partial [Nitrososphaerales archaeon]